MALIKKDDGRIYYRFDESVSFSNWDAAYHWLATFAAVHKVGKLSERN